MYVNVDFYTLNVSNVVSNILHRRHAKLPNVCMYIYVYIYIYIGYMYRCRYMYMVMFIICSHAAFHVPTSCDSLVRDPSSRKLKKTFALSPPRVVFRSTKILS